MNGINALIAQGIKMKPIDFAGIQSTQLQNELRKLQLENARMQMEQMPEEQNWLRKSRNMETEKFGWEREKVQQQREERPFRNSKEMMEFYEQWQDVMQYDDWDKTRSYLTKRGIPESTLPPKEFFDQNGTVDPEIARSNFKLWKEANPFLGLKKRMELEKMGIERSKVRALEKKYSMEPGAKPTTDQKNFEAENPEFAGKIKTAEYGRAFMKWRKNQKIKEGASQTEEQLTARALKGDKEAQSILDAMQNRRLQLAESTMDVKSKAVDVDAIGEAIAEGQDARIAIKGSMGNPVASKAQSYVLKKYPKFDFNMSDANYKWKQSTVNQRTINFVGGSLPRVEALANQLRALKNTDIPAINKIMRQVSIQTGRPEYTNFESNRNAIVQEINTALSGSSTGSDMRIKIELENLQSARSPQQIIGSINNLREALIARLDVDLSPIYPLEVVQGKKSVEQYKKELFQEYRGKYGQEAESPEGQDISRKEAFEKLRAYKKWTDEEINKFLDKKGIK